MALLGDRGWAILIAGRLNCGRSILNLFDYMKATESPGDGHRPPISRSATERPSGYGPLEIKKKKIKISSILQFPAVPRHLEASERCLWRDQVVTVDPERNNREYFILMFYIYF